MKYLLLPLILASIIFSGAQAAPAFKIESFDQPYEFSGIKKILFFRGDSGSFSDPAEDDSSWESVSLPSNWKKSYPDWNKTAWYRIHFIFPDVLPDRTLGISLGTISDTDEVFFNGQLIGKSGSFPPERVSSYDKKRLYEIPSALIRPGRDNVIAVRMMPLFSTEAGAHRGKFIIAPVFDLQKSIFIKDLFDLIFIVIYLAVSAYFTVLFFSRSAGKEYVFFALFCSATACYLFMWSQLKYLFSDNFLLMKRIEYSLITFIIPCAAFYISSFFKKKTHLMLYVFSITAVCLLPVYFVTDKIADWNVFFQIYQILWTVPLSYSLLTSYRESRIDRSAKLVFIPFMLLCILLVNDILVIKNVYNFIRLSNYGFIVMIISNAALMRSRFMILRSAIPADSFKAKSPVTDESKIKIESAVKYLDENYSSDISREALAYSLGINPDYLGKLFKTYIGKTMNEYLNSVRIDNALSLLRKGGKSVTEIAFECGFESLSTFYRVFQGITGKQPLFYMRNDSEEDKMQEMSRTELHKNERI